VSSEVKKSQNGKETNPIEKLSSSNTTIEKEKNRTKSKEFNQIIDNKFREN
jgi:hypothetical protein